ncbi:MAG: hypothetical protein WAL32_05825 [Terriglobales bacterium]
MKLAVSALWLAFPLFLPLLLSQTLVSRPYVIRAETTVFDTYTGMVHTCILVQPDGHYRRERTFQGMSGGTPYVDIYVDTLPDDTYKRLQAILDNADFQKISTPPSRGGVIQNMDTLIVSIPREHSMQNMYFMTANERRPYEKDLKPLMNWMKDVQKLKVHALKEKASDNCAAPMVQFKSSLPALELEQKPKQP